MPQSIREQMRVDVGDLLDFFFLRTLTSRAAIAASTV